MKELDRTLRLMTARTMGEVELVRQALVAVKQAPSGIRERVAVFDNATDNISNSVVLRDFKAKEMPHLSAFRRLFLKIEEAPTNLGDIASSYDYYVQEDPTDKFIASTDAAISETKRRLTSGELRLHPDVFSSPNTFLARLLVEGFAIGMQNDYRLPETASKYKKALKEVLLKDYPNAALTEDLLWWDQLEADEARCITLADYLVQRNERRGDSMKAATDRLNASFRENVPAYEVLDDLRIFPKPILVDFNNVIANNRYPLRLNPEAPQFLEALRQIGDIFIVTSAISWRRVHGFMVEHSIWDPNMVLMVRPVWEFMDDKDNPEAIKLRQEYLKVRSDSAQIYEDSTLYKDTVYKQVGPLFGRQQAVPFIDNDSSVTSGNPGILGIEVKEWISEDERATGFPSFMHSLDERNAQLPSLAEAVATVKEYYK